MKQNTINLIFGIIWLIFGCIAVYFGQDNVLNYGYLIIGVLYFIVYFYFKLKS